MKDKDVKEMYGADAIDYGCTRPEKNTMILRVFKPN